MSNLYTAFKGFHNTSFQLVNQINGDKVFLTNSFQGLEKDIFSLSTDYDAIYMFGIDKNLRNGIRIETCANYNGELVNTLKGKFIKNEDWGMSRKEDVPIEKYAKLKGRESVLFYYIPLR